MTGGEEPIGSNLICPLHPKENSCYKCAMEIKPLREKVRSEGTKLCCKKNNNNAMIQVNKIDSSNHAPLKLQKISKLL